MKDYTPPSLAQFEHHSEVLSREKSILRSGRSTTKCDFQHFIATFLFKLHLLPQLLSSIKGKSNNISSLKTTMILQRKNSQNLRSSFGILNGNGNQSLFNLSNGWSPPNHYLGIIAYKF